MQNRRQPSIKILYKIADILEVDITELFRSNMELKKLADFIMSEVEGEPRQDGGAGTCAIRIIKDLTNKNQQLIEALEKAKSEIIDLTDSDTETDNDVWYPDYIDKVLNLHKKERRMK